MHNLAGTEGGQADEQVRRELAAVGVPAVAGARDGEVKTAWRGRLVLRGRVVEFRREWSYWSAWCEPPVPAEFARQLNDRPALALCGDAVVRAGTTPYGRLGNEMRAYGRAGGVGRDEIVAAVGVYHLDSPGALCAFVGALRELADAERAAEVPAIAALQASLPWDAHQYNAAFRARTDPQRDAQHAVLHLGKALGRLAGVRRAVYNHATECRQAGLPVTGRYLRDDARKYLADLLICAARVANTWPGGPVGLAPYVARQADGPKRPGVPILEVLADLLACVEAFDHAPDPAAPDPAARDAAAEHLAIVCCTAAATAAEWPGEPIDLDAAVAWRVAAKFGPGGAP